MTLLLPLPTLTRRRRARPPDVLVLRLGARAPRRQQQLQVLRSTIAVVAVALRIQGRALPPGHLPLDKFVHVGRVGTRDGPSFFQPFQRREEGHAAPCGGWSSAIACPPRIRQTAPRAASHEI